jgi:hypothetical protein
VPSVSKALHINKENIGRRAYFNFLQLNSSKKNPTRAFSFVAQQK